MTDEQRKREQQRIAREEAELEQQCQKHSGQSFLLKPENTLVPREDKPLETSDD